MSAIWFFTELHTEFNCVLQGHMIDVADLTQSIAGFEESIRKCKTVLRFTFVFICTVLMKPHILIFSCFM